jgi:hypothetical protein
MPIETVDTRAVRTRMKELGDKLTELRRLL